MLTAIALSSALTLCLPISEFATNIMAARQAGAPLSKALTVSERPVMQALIISAYRKPLYRTTEFQERATREFADQVLLQCLDGVKE